MSYPERFFVRVVMASWTIVYVVLTIVFLLIDIQWVFWLGVLSALYFSDRLLHYSKSQLEIPQEGESQGNIALYMSPRARRTVVSAYSKATVLGGGFYLNLARILSETKPVLEMLKRLEISEKEFNAKLDAYLLKDLVSYRDKERLLAEVESLVFTALGVDGGSKEAIDYTDLFVALGYMKNEQIDSLFRVFEINGETLERVSFFGRLAGSGILKKRCTSRFSQKDTVMFGALSLEKEYGVYFTYAAIRSATNIASRYSSDEKILPTTLALLKSTAGHISGLGDGVVNSDDISASVERIKSSKEKINI